MQTYYDRNIPQIRAHKAVENSILSGRLQRPSHCDACRKGCKPLAHHNNYAQQLEVNWLCAKCHQLVHKRFSGLFTQEVATTLAAIS